MKSFWTSGASSISTTATVFIPIIADPGTIPNSFTETGISVALSEDVTITRLKATLSAAPGVGKNRTFTFRDDSVGTSAAVTISDAATSAEWTGSVSVAALSLVCIQSVPTGTPAASTVRILIEYTTGGDYFLLPTIITSAISATTTTNYLNPGSVSSGGYSSTAGSRELVMPTAGSVTKLTARTTVAPGAAKSWAVSMRLNNTTDSLTATVTGAATTVATTTGSTAVVAGNTIALKWVPAGTPAAAAIQTCLTIAPTTAGEIVIGANIPSLTTTTTANFGIFQGSGNNSWSATETGRQLLFPAGTVSKLYLKTSAAPGTAKSYTFTLRRNAANTALTQGISAAATTGNDTTHTVTTTDGDLVAMQSVAAGTPTAADGRFAVVFVYPPTATNTGAFFAMF